MRMIKPLYPPVRSTWLAYVALGNDARRSEGPGLFSGFDAQALIKPLYPYKTPKSPPSPPPASSYVSAAPARPADSYDPSPKE